jgi:hypothetical protein
MSLKTSRRTPATLSRRFELAVHDFRKSARLYELAQRAQLTPQELSAYLHGARPIYREDPRVIRLGAVLGLAPEQCFARPRRSRSGVGAAA